jgi:S1-C subfamily serine protease
MVNKLVIGILILLVIFTGLIGYYSYTLNQQIYDLGERLTAYEIEQAGRVDNISNELSRLRTETLGKFGTLEGQIGATQAEVGDLQAEIGKIENRISAIEDEIAGVASEVDILDNRITSVVNEVSGSVLDASAIYEKVSRVTVRISNGQSTAGSGLILDTEGHVITAQHVVDGLSPIYVIMHDGVISSATIVGQCKFSDIAVLKLNKNPHIEPLSMADSSQVRIGEPVLTVGNPLDLHDTLTTGIISQTNRYAEIPHDMQSRWVTNLLQFDAAINYGNSGCPLINADGDIIGIVVARIYPAEGDGIYFAVSSNKAKRVAEAILAQGFFEYPWIGFNPADLTPQIVEQSGLETANGVLVGGVISGGPAEEAGIEVNDIILSINGITVMDSAGITSYLGEHTSPGDMATIIILRDSNIMELSIEIGRREE